MPNDLCVVCGSKSNTYSFGVFCCRACGAFFRRSQTKTYTCRREKKCSVEQEGMRNACRACRLTRCYQSGMTGEADAKTRVSSSLQSSTQSTRSVVSASVVNLYLPERQMSQLQEVDPQKSLYSIENPSTIFEDTEFQPISKTLFTRMENGTNSLINNLIYETLDFYGCLEAKLKIEVAKQVSQKYAALHRCFLTAKYFPSLGDERIATHFGYYIDVNNIDQFFEVSGSTSNLEQKTELIVPVLNLLRKTSNRFRELQVRDLEVAALASVFIWCQLEDMDLITKEMDAKRDATHREFHSNVIGKYGLEVGSTRLIRVMSLIQNILELNSSYGEMCLLASIFSPSQDCPGNCSLLPAYPSA